MSKLVHFRQFTNGEWFADIDGKRISRKSSYDAVVYSDPYDKDHPFTTFKSRIQHCGSCLSDAEYGHGLDECCCIHSGFKSKKEENDYVKSIGFWKIRFEGAAP